jgi:D-alanyl-D-alanine carboxypeptidase
MMTLRARALGMNRTSFRNASGLPDSNQWTTARDLAMLGRRIVLDFPQLYGYFGVSGFVWHNRVIPNHDTMLRTYPGADGMKTGFTDYAGHNLETSAVRGGVRLIGVVMGAASNTERDQNMATLLDDGFNQMNSPVSRVASLFGVANAATTIPMAPAQPAPVLAAAQLAPEPPPVRVARDRAVQIGAFPAEHTAWQIAQDSARLAPDAQPRVQQVIYRRHTVYHAELLGLSETEARSVCANFARRAPGCQIFRIGMASSAQR